MSTPAQQPLTQAVRRRSDFKDRGNYLNGTSKIPLTLLRLYAAFWIVMSVFGVVASCLLFLYGHVFKLFPVAILGIFIGIGLLRNWRFSWIAAFLVLLAASAFFGQGLLFFLSKG